MCSSSSSSATQLTLFTNNQQHCQLSVAGGRLGPGKGRVVMMVTCNMMQDIIGPRTLFYVSGDSCTLHFTLYTSSCSLVIWHNQWTGADRPQPPVAPGIYHTTMPGTDIVHGHSGPSLVMWTHCSLHHILLHGERKFRNLKTEHSLFTVIVTIDIYCVCVRVVLIH